MIKNLKTHILIDLIISGIRIFFIRHFLAIKLNNLIGKKLQLGNVLVEGIDLCRPCKHLTEMLNQDNIIKEFLRKGGLRCQILNSSKINVDDEVKVVD